LPPKVYSVFALVAELYSHGRASVTLVCHSFVLSKCLKFPFLNLLHSLLESLFGMTLS